MSWLLPGFLAGAVFIGLPLLLHFLRGKPKTVVRFPSLRLLGATAVRDSRRHRIQRWLTLLLRCLAIAALAAAFARPFWTDAAAARRTVVIVGVDNSMSMQARGRWEEAKREALARLDALQPGDEAGLFTMQPDPAWLAPVTDDVARVRTTLAGLAPGFERTRYAGAVRFAGDALAGIPAANRELVWMADEQRIGWAGMDFSRQLPPGVKLVPGRTATVPKRQAAITKVRSDRGRLTATVRLYSPGPDARTILVFADNRIVARQATTLRDGENSIVLPLPAGLAAGHARVALDPADDLPADDVAWVVLEKDAAGKVLLDPADEPDFLAEALRATRKMGDGKLEPLLAPDRDWPAGGPAIVRNGGTFRTPGALDRFLDAGGAAWVFVDGSAEQLAWLERRGIHVTERTGADEAWHLRDWDPGHPILAAYAGQSLLPLLEVEFHRGFDLSGDALQPIANWPDGAPAIAEWSVDGHRLLIAGFLLTRESTNWPTQPSFVPFVHQAVQWLGAFASPRSDWRIGEAIPLPDGEGAWRSLASPMSSPERAVRGSVRPEAPGVYEFKSPSARKLYAVNVPVEESDLTPWPQPQQILALQDDSPPRAPDAARAPDLLSAEVAENQQRIWWWLLAAGVVVILAELALANRTAL